MFGFNQRGASGYAKVSAETGVIAASPIRLIIMLYDGAIVACHSAITHMQQGDIVNKGLMLTKAISIIESGLRVSLDKGAGGDIAISLDSLYEYMVSQLHSANIRNNTDLVNVVIRLLSELKGAWEAIDQIQVAAKTPSLSNELKAMTNSSQDSLHLNRNLAAFAKV